ncbi:monoacylglycerol lipase ABHD2-like [Saccoglossus kowalevskii]
MGRFNCPVPRGVRRSVLMPDGATCTFDVFEPTEPHPQEGCTEEYAAMISYIESRHSDTHMIAAGFSMGANIVLKYLGEDTERQDKFLCGLSLCQGYDCFLGKDFLHRWESLRRLYNFAMTENQKLVLKRNKDMLFGAGAKAYYLKEGKKPPEYDLENTFEATSLMHIDDSFTR